MLLFYSAKVLSFEQLLGMFLNSEEHLQNNFIKAVKIVYLDHLSSQFTSHSYGLPLPEVISSTIEQIMLLFLKKQKCFSIMQNQQKLVPSGIYSKQNLTKDQVWNLWRRCYKKFCCFFKDLKNKSTSLKSFHYYSYIKQLLQS